MRKKIASVILAISMVLSPVIGSSSLVKALSNTKGIVNTSSNLNVRKSPSLNSSIIGKLSPNVPVEIVETVGEWYKIKLGSSYGYVYKKYVKIDTSSQEKSEEIKKIYDRIVEPDKTWKINFNHKINLDETVKKEIKIKNSKGVDLPLKLELSQDFKSILISPPEDGYELGDSYTLTLGTGIKSASGLKLKEGKKLNFGIKRLVNKTLGLGKYETEYVHNDKEYDWYIDQYDTGEYNYENCGPSSVTMAIKWAKPSFNKTAQDARNTYRSQGGWWFTYDIQNYLDKYKVKNWTLEDTKESTFKKELKSGNIIILCIDSNYITYNDKEEEHVGKHYQGGGGHFIVVKGYRVVDDKTYFEVYDPNSWGEVYKDGVKKGKDRYYYSEDVKKSMENWWPYMIVVNGSDNGGYAKQSYGVDTSKIEHAQGK
ncbi:SH3 domain-containing protein [Clostridium brassicae]|uniref:SH3 domain-containing protein n=1 Tax=Clostridium brassicae TaxID=2999072 RepID=A0ABT4DDC4_9CLOT|nr:SH3 domain-containing protein [Clostridium brassicae]MCY6960310.1 SH3 domain-containing protein [Clostridium brassicae]